MFNKTSITVFVLPAIFMAAGIALVARPVTVGGGLGDALPMLPYVPLALAAGMGVWFKRIRVALLAGMVAVCQWTLLEFPAASGGDNLLVIFAALAVLFPLNAIALVWMQSNRVVSTPTLARLVLIAVQVLALAVIWDAGPAARAGADAALHARVFSPAFDHWSVLPQAAIILFALAALAMMIRAAISGSPIDGGMTAAIIATAMAMHSGTNSEIHSLLLALAGAVLAIAVIQDTYRMAFIDELTSLPGRRALMMDMQGLGNSYTVAMLDVDHFKKFNDTYGHDVGDQVLKLVASKMMRVTGGGRPYRYGGEEFTVLFSGKSVEHALAHLEKLRISIAESKFTIRSDDRPREKPRKQNAAPKSGAKTAGGGKQSGLIGVTISIGAAHCDDGTAEETIKSADKALYRAKEAGRNRVAR